MGITNGGRPAYDHWLVSPIIRALFSVALAPPFLRNNVSSLLESYVRFQVGPALHSHVAATAHLLYLCPLARSLTRRCIAALTPAQPKCPQLFLYSKGDELIPYTDIELAIRATNDLGIPATGVRSAFVRLI